MVGSSPYLRVSNRTTSQLIVLEVLTVTDSFGDVAREMLAPYQIFCRNLQKCICEFPSARTKVIDSVGALVSRMIDR
jgi:hypothetical protein